MLNKNGRRGLRTLHGATDGRTNDERTHTGHETRPNKRNQNTGAVEKAKTPSEAQSALKTSQGRSRNVHNHPPVSVHAQPAPRRRGPAMCPAIGAAA